MWIEKWTPWPWGSPYTSTREKKRNLQRGLRKMLCEVAEEPGDGGVLETSLELDCLPWGRTESTMLFILASVIKSCILSSALPRRRSGQLCQMLLSMEQQPCERGKALASHSPPAVEPRSLRSWLPSSWPWDVRVAQAVKRLPSAQFMIPGS